jgi:hypothetical protein
LDYRWNVSLPLLKRGDPLVILNPIRAANSSYDDGVAGLPMTD